jgi:hypothetical protein
MRPRRWANLATVHLQKKFKNPVVIVCKGATARNKNREKTPYDFCLWYVMECYHYIPFPHQYISFSSMHLTLTNWNSIMLKKLLTLLSQVPVMCIL